jgi:predicted CoA-binding protein
MITKTSVENFLSQKNITVIDISHNPKKIGDTIYCSLKKKGNNVFPITRMQKRLQGKIVVPIYNLLPELVDGVVVNVSPSETENVVVDLSQAGIEKAWMQQGSQSKVAEEYCSENGIDCISNECILMFAEPTGFIHRAHRWVKGVMGNLPR